MRKLIYIISAVLLLAFASGASAGSCGDGDFNDCKVKAEQGDADAQLRLGMMYHLGAGVVQDDKKSFYWSSKAAEQGNSAAQSLLDAMYHEGTGIAQDYVMAHMFYNIAETSGNKEIANFRDEIVKMMTPSQIEKAQDLAREWMEKHQ